MVPSMALDGPEPSFSRSLSKRWRPGNRLTVIGCLARQTCSLLSLGVLAVVLHLDDAPPRADLVFANRGEIFTLDPQRMSWLQDFRMAYALYEGLARWNNTDYSLEPATASLFIVSPFAGGARLSRLFSTHPPMQERIQRLRAMAGQV